ncbi:DNA polymerase III subunit alpha [Candidatus Leptofilum sp.]|uniref:DNA polymerase III subunit alpha n=1 Tax=Candidatus Leptofilum sp. TaxID=3241576 RepID=UPI003B5BAD97
MCENHNQFVHLHCHSEFSLLDGLSRVKDLVNRAAELDQPAIALTDHGAMYGTMPFYRAAKSAGIKPIIGVETYLAQRTMQDRDPQLDKNRFHMLLLAENQTGYLNLLQIASKSQLDGYYYKPRIDRAFMAAHSEGLIATTGCMAAEIPRALGDNNPKLAKKLMGEYLDIFGKDRLFIELQEHSIPELTEINRKLVEMAPHFGLENNFLATNDVHYTLASDADPHEVLLCIQTGSTVNAPKLTFSDKEYYVKSRDEMFQLFQRNGYQEELILNSLANSLRIVEMCDVNLDSEGYHLPEFEVPAGYDPHSYLRFLCERGLAWRYGGERAESDAELRARLDHELNIISRMGFETYFLIVWDLCEWAARSDEWWEQYQDPFPYDSYSAWKENDIWWNVRGSGAGSVVAYTLGITSIDPLANGLIFERFLNPGRVSMPDIDLDYPDDVRHWMVAYSKRRYGSEKVAQIITFGTLGARAAIRDVGRAMDMPLEEVDVIARMVPAIPGKPVKIENVLDKEHEFYSNELEQKYKGETAVRTLLDTARNLEGVARHASSHAAGVIISDKPLHEYVPLNKPTSGDEGLGGVDRVTQWPMEIVESIGLLKVDFLGLSTLTVMRRAARLIEERYGIAYTMDNIPYDEGHVGPDSTKKPEILFDMLGRGEVAGVFQVEGAGMRRLMMEMKPRRFDHIMAAISLYRPGPMENIPEYIRRMHSAIYDEKDIVEYHDPALEPILNDTYGILVYQEQIIRIASDLAGYEPGEADIIRKAVSKKKKDLMEKHHAQFVDRVADKGLSREVGEAIWGDIEFFARYGFNKAHAADYAKVTCQTAFLKAHYPVEYLTAMLSVERDNTEKVRRYFAEAKNLGIDVGPPDINSSGLDFTIEDDGERPLIRFGLGAIKNAGAAALMTIIEEREANGTFEDLQDLCKRVDLKRVGKRPLEYMAKGRVFDTWGTPEQFVDALDRIVNFSSSEHAAASTGQMSLFGGGASTPALNVAVDLLHHPKQLKPVKHKELLEWEKEALGVHVSEHPLERPLAMLQSRTNATIGDIDTNWNGKQVRLAGMISTLRPLTTKKGDPMAFATLEDLDGKLDLVLFPRTWKACRDDVAVDQVMLVTGKVQLKGEDVNLIVDRVETNLEIAQDADATPSAKPNRAKQTAILPQTNGNGKAQAYTPPPPTHVAEPKPTLQQTVPPRETAVASNNRMPPPPPNFDADSEARLVAQPAGNGTVAMPTKQPLVSPAPTRQTNGIHKIVVVEVRPVGNWQAACRRVLNKVNEYEGSDGLAILISGQDLKMEFENGRTRSCPELLETLRTIPGIAKVYNQ